MGALGRHKALDKSEHPAGTPPGQFTFLGPVDPQQVFKNNIQTSSGHHASVTFSMITTDTNAISGAFLTYKDGPLKNMKVQVNSNVGFDPTVRSSIHGVGAKLSPEQIAQVKKDMTEILQSPDMQFVATKQVHGEAVKIIDPEITLSANKLIQSFQEQPKSAPNQGRKNGPADSGPKPH